RVGDLGAAVGADARMSARRGRSFKTTACMALLAAVFAIHRVPVVWAQPAQPPGPAVNSATQKIPIVLAREQRDRLPPLSLRDFAPDDDGVAGARLAINDNNTTGRFLQQTFALETVQSPSVTDLVAEVIKRVDAGAGFVIADASPEGVLALADALK